MNFLSVKENDRLLIIAPHPDDECIGAGGLLTLYPGHCHVLVLTDGRIGQSNYSSSETVRIRSMELANELSSLNISYDCLGMEDGSLIKHPHILGGYDLRMFTKIFTTGMDDNHPDHSAAYMAVREAIKQQDLETEVYLYEVHNPLDHPTHMLDISGVIDEKLRLIRFHESQIAVQPYDRMACALAEYRALQNRLRDSYVEVYKKDLCIKKDTQERPLEIELQKQRMFYKVLTSWMELKNKGWSLARELKSRGYDSISVYGYAELGKLVADEIRNDGNVSLVHILDKRPQDADGLSVLYPDGKHEESDCVVVTAIFYFDEICKELTDLKYKNVLSLKEIIESVQ